MHVYIYKFKIKSSRTIFTNHILSWTIFNKYLPILKIFIIFINKSVLRMNFKIFWHQINENDNETIIYQSFV